MRVFKIETDGKKYVFNLVKVSSYDNRNNGYILETDNANSLSVLKVGQVIKRLDIFDNEEKVTTSLIVKEINGNTLTLLHPYLTK